MRRQTQLRKNEWGVSRLAIAPLGFGGLVLLAPVEAYAYLGPGGAVSAVGTLIALGAAVLVAVIGFLWFPLRRLMRKPNDAGAEDSIASPSAPTGDGVDGGGGGERDSVGG
jgi:hypothetical protein